MSELKEYRVSVPYSGYSRGEKVYSVKAESPEDALERVKEGDYDGFIEMNTYRDDTESEWDEAELA